jgi:hypothetical protein
MSEQYRGFYFIHAGEVKNLTKEQLWDEIEEYDRRCEVARERGEGISTKEGVRDRLCRAEVYQRTWGNIPIEQVQKFFEPIS